MVEDTLAGANDSAVLSNSLFSSFKANTVHWSLPLQGEFKMVFMYQGSAITLALKLKCIFRLCDKSVGMTHWILAVSVSWHVRGLGAEWSVLQNCSTLVEQFPLLFPGRALQ